MQIFIKYTRLSRHQALFLVLLMMFTLTVGCSNDHYPKDLQPVVVALVGYVHILLTPVKSSMIHCLRPQVILVPQSLLARIV